MNIGNLIKQYLNGKTEQAEPIIQTSDEKLFAELKEIIKPCLKPKYENREILPSDEFEMILIDSLTGIEMVIHIEEEYDIRIMDEDMQKWKMVEDAVKYVHNALQTKCASQNKEK